MSDGKGSPRLTSSKSRSLHTHTHSFFLGLGVFCHSAIKAAERDHVSRLKGADEGFSGSAAGFRTVQDLGARPRGQGVWTSKWFGFRELGLILEPYQPCDMKDMASEFPSSTKDGGALSYLGSSHHLTILVSLHEQKRDSSKNLVQGPNPSNKARGPDI